MPNPSRKASPKEEKWNIAIVVAFKTGLGGLEEVLGLLLDDVWGRCWDMFGRFRESFGNCLGTFWGVEGIFQTCVGGLWDMFGKF